MNLLPMPSMFLLPVVGAAGTIATLRSDDEQLNLILIVLCVVAVVIISKFSRYQRDKMWHETARIALEKGQPVPSRWSFPAADWPRRGGGSCFWFSPWWDIRRGLILLAVGGALYFALNNRARDWMAVPAAIGAVYLVIGVVRLMFQNSNPPDHRDPPAQP